MIEKMSFVNIVGPKDSLDNIATNYISKYEIHLENALSELKTTENIIPFNDVNPYKKPLDRIDSFMRYIRNVNVSNEVEIDYDEATTFIRNLNHDFKESKLLKDKIKSELSSELNKLNQIKNYRSLNINLSEVLNYKNINFRFGRIHDDYYHKLEKIIFENPDIIFMEGGHDGDYVYGMYFTSSNYNHEADAIFSSLHFEKVYIPGDYHGTPSDACKELEDEIINLRNKLKSINDNIKSLFESNAAKIFACHKLLNNLNDSFEIRKVAALTNRKSEPYFILCGYMSVKDALKLKEDLTKEPDTTLMIESNDSDPLSKPPTKLKNPWFLKPFEMFVKMYGLTDYNEMDPTWFVALTYTLIFGVMFGDVGHGLLLMIFGFLIYAIKKTPLAAIIGCAGIFSTFFGVMFGSIFGFEDIIKPVWLKPISAMSNVSFVGSLNTIFVVTIGFGMLLVMISMILHIVNAIKSGEIGSALFDSNGLSGLVFYGCIVLMIVSYMKGFKTPFVIMLILLIVCVLLMALNQPLSSLIIKHKAKLNTSKAMFITQAFFELFETMLSYFSNTLSFVRIGAFAVSHAAMMEVVMMLSGAEKGAPNWVVVILGNLFVCAMEGLIVGIQVLRLEYYEMFSRFYKGSGKEFKPYNKLHN